MPSIGYCTCISNFGYYWSLCLKVQTFWVRTTTIPALQAKHPSLCPQTFISWKKEKGGWHDAIHCHEHAWGTTLIPKMKTVYNNVYVSDVNIKYRPGAVIGVCFLHFSCCPFEFITDTRLPHLQQKHACSVFKQVHLNYTRKLSDFIESTHLVYQTWLYLCDTQLYSLFLHNQ